MRKSLKELVHNIRDLSKPGIPAAVTTSTRTKSKAFILDVQASDEEQENKVRHNLQHRRLLVSPGPIPSRFRRHDQGPQPCHDLTGHRPCSSA